MEILAKTRNVTGSKVKTLRNDGYIPCVIFSKKTSQGGVDSILIAIEQIAFEKMYKEAGESTIITVKVEGEKDHETLISEVQVDPVSDIAIHASFFEVDLTEKITANIPVEIINEEEALPVKTKQGIIITVLSEVEIECLPRDLPQHFDVDVSIMQEVGDMLTVKDVIKVDPAKITILTDMNEVVAKVDYAEQQEVEEEEAVSVDDVEVEEKGKKDENEEGEEGGEDVAGKKGSESEDSKTD